MINGPTIHPAPLQLAIIGSAGRLGQALKTSLARHPGITPHFFNRSQLNLADQEQLARCCEESNWDAVIIAAAMTNVDACEDDQELAWTINALAPATIAQYVSAHTRVIYISTDFVFAGDCNVAYQENDVPLPCNAYGRGKLAGEEGVMAANPHNLVVRSSWLFGGGKPSLPDIMIDRACRFSEIEIVHDRWSSPTYVDDLADAILQLLQNKEACGIYHFCNEGTCSPFEYCSWAIECARREGISIKATAIKPVSTPESGVLKASRPTYSVMSKDRLVSAINAPPRHWMHALQEHVSKIAAQNRNPIPVLAAWLPCLLFDPSVHLL